MDNLPKLAVGMALFALAGATHAGSQPAACKQAAARQQPMLVALDVRVDAHDEMKLVTIPGQKAVFSVEDRVYTLLPTIVERPSDRYGASDPNKTRLVSIKMTLPSREEVHLTTPTGESARVNAIQITPRLITCHNRDAKSK